MIYVEHTEGCRLGNILFQIGAALSLDNDVVFCYKDKSVLTYLQPYKNNLLKNITLQKEVPSREEIKHYEEPFSECYIYHPIPYVSGEPFLIKGFFQSFRHLNREKILQQFAINQRVNDFIISSFPYLQKNEWTSIHVRRGDFLNNANKYRHPVCTMNYYKKAIRYFGSEMNFLIMSDDIPWCRTQFRGRNFFFAEGTSPIVDLYLPSFCQNNIISNSSFGWWGAYLNHHKENVVVAPKRWIGYVAELKVQDLLPQRTIIINNQYSWHFVVDFIWSRWNRIRYNKEYLFFRKLISPFVMLKQHLMHKN